MVKKIITMAEACENVKRRREYDNLMHKIENDIEYCKDKINNLENTIDNINSVISDIMEKKKQLEIDLQELKLNKGKI